MNRPLETLERVEDRSATAEDIFRAACRDVAAYTGANRVSIWHFEEGQTRMRCDCFYVVQEDGNAQEDTFTSGQVLTQADHPTYFRTILTEQSISAVDANRHPATMELSVPYFRDHDIRSLLDFIIHENFAPIGVICCENAGAIRHWSQDDVRFLRLIATLISFHLTKKTA